MALGKIKADTLEHSTSGSVNTKYVVEGSVKAFSEQDNDSPNPPNKSLNQSSITDSSGGHKIHNFASAFSDKVYLCLTGCCGNRGSTTASVRGVMPDGTFTTTAADMRYAYATQTAEDDTQAGIAVLGDLA